jgi:hypothetical protein
MKNNPHCCNPPNKDCGGVMIVIFYVSIALHKAKNLIKKIFTKIF